MRSFLLVLTLLLLPDIALADGPCYLKSTSTACFKPVEVTSMAGPAATGASGYLSSTDWNTFNGKQPLITILATNKGGTGVSGSAVFPSAGTVLTDSNVAFAYSKSIVTGPTPGTPNFPSQFTDGADQTKVMLFDQSGQTTGTTRTVTWPNVSLTVDGAANTATLTNKTISGSSNTITNVSLTTGVTGVLPVANIAGPAAAATNGYLSSTDWATFNNKVGTARSISTTAPITGGGDLSADRTIAITQAATAANGYLSSTDWNTFNAKQPLISTLSPANGGTGVANNAASTTTISGNFASTETRTGTTTVTFPTTGTLATLAGTEAFTAKDYQGGNASDTSRLTVPSNTIANLVGLTRKAATVVVDTVSGKALIDDGANLNPIALPGEKNYLLAAASTKQTWLASSNVTPTTTVTTQDMARPYTTATAILFTATGAGYGHTCIGPLDPADYNKKFKLQFDQSCGQAVGATSACVAGDFSVDVYPSANSNCSSPGTRLALSTDSSAVSLLPALTGTYRTTFDTAGSATPYYDLRITRVANSHAIALSDVIVGPGIVTQGAVVEGWKSYTPTTHLTNTTVTGAYRRVGSEIHVHVNFLFTGAPVGSYTHTVAEVLNGLGLTLDTSKPASTTSYSDTCNWYGLDNGVANYAGHCWMRDASNIFFSDSGAAPGLVSVTNPWTQGSTDSFTFDLQFPIAEWAGSGTVNVDTSASTECVYNSDVSSTPSVTLTGFATGPGGVAFSSNFAVGTQYTRRVRFTNPYGSIGNIGIDILRQNGWVDLGATNLNHSRQGATEYGMQALPVSGSTTDVDVEFENGGQQGSNATYAGNGTGFSAATALSWRVCKRTGYGALGFANVTQTGAGLVQSAGQLLGTNTNDSATAGNVGEVLTFASRTVTTSGSSSWTANASTLTTLTAGTWLICGTYTYPATNAANDFRAGVATNNTSDGTGIITSGAISVAANASAANDSSLPMNLLVYATTGTAIYAKAFTEDTGSVAVVITGFAVRIR